MKIRQLMAKPLTHWTLVGPLDMPSDGVDLCPPLPLDAATKPPETLQWQGRPVSVVRVETDPACVDFHVHLPAAPGRPGGFAFCEIDAPEDGTLRFALDTDWQSILWLDGREIFSLREGNQGAPGRMRHRVAVGLSRGRHVLTARVVAGVDGWTLMMNDIQWSPGIDGLLRTDRQATWRDYSQTLVRYENRHLPDGTIDGIPVEQAEQLLAHLGVEARWISVVHACQGALYPSDHLPLWSGAKPEYEENLRRWVDILHSHKLCAMTWYPLCYNHAAAETYPDWRQQFLAPPPKGNIHHEFACCINSPYGQAVKDFTVESLVKFDFDAVYFDGSSFTPIWEKPFPVSCVCPHCRKKFRAETGLDIPASLDWTQPAFRRWVQWRYDMFTAYWQELTDAIHAAVPEAKVVFNHYHRERIPWVGAVPLQPFGRNFIRGTEADSEPMRGMFYTRCMRAAGEEATEVWMNVTPRGLLNTPRGTRHNPKPVLEFMLACTAAGGHAATGGCALTLEGPTLQRLADALEPGREYLDAPAAPYAALHVSQQTDTFVFGRNPAITTDAKWTDHYWASLVGWHNAIALAGRYCDVIYDDQLTHSRLKNFPLLVMPLAPALTETQWRNVLRYVRTGGTLVTGPWFGLCDEWGETRDEALGDRDLFPFGSEVPPWENLKHRSELLFSVKEGKTKSKRFHARPLSACPLRRKIIQLDWRSQQLTRRTKIGKGVVIQLSIDLGTLFRESPSVLLVKAVRNFLETVPRPRVELLGHEPLLMGVFQNSRRATAVHVRPCTPPWEPFGEETSPPVREGVQLRWNGPRPRRVLRVEPKQLAPLPVRRTDSHWRIALPPMTWGQIILIET